jgi:hypothetical protein
MTLCLTRRVSIDRNTVGQESFVRQVTILDVINHLSIIARIDMSDEVIQD